VYPEIFFNNNVSSNKSFFDKSAWIGSSEQFEKNRKKLDKLAAVINLAKYIKLIGLLSLIWM
tara:strand:- start:374 stop:559 length:186 start_codon:yes stop_codon:yes gene_type:complete